MHAAVSYVTTFHAEILKTASKPARRGLTLNESEAIARGLATDAEDYVHSALTSTVNAIRGLAEGFSSWSIVKAYYAAFYSCRACLALDGWGCFYINEKPFRVRAVRGEFVERSERSSHKAVLNLFTSHFRSDPIATQRIDLLPPLQWLQQLRESVNYTDPHFCEPELHVSLRQLDHHHPGFLFDKYLTDSSHLYAFLADHAALALPAICLTRMFESCRKHGLFPLSQADVSFLQRCLARPSCRCRSLHSMIGALEVQR